MTLTAGGEASSPPGGRDRTSGDDLIGQLVAALDPEQRAAALLPDGPAQILAPAGSGKTTTLVARLGVLLARGVPAEAILVLTFNRDAALELAARLASRLSKVVPAATQIEVRTLHAIGRRILLDAGETRQIIADRSPLVRAARRRLIARRAAATPVPEADAIDAPLSAWKLEGRAPELGDRALIDEYQLLLNEKGAIDFDDLIGEAVRRLETSPMLRTRWQRRFTHVLVDEFQDVDAAQFRLIGLLAEPEAHLFVVGDDDQTIYAWRLADVRRMLNFATSYPGATQVMLATNYRCPPEVVRASRQLIDHNQERFPKRIDAGAPHAGREPAILCLASGTPQTLGRFVRIAAAATEATRACFLARTRTELLPVAVALLRAGVRHATSLAAPLDAPPVTELLQRLAHAPRAARPAAVLHRLRGASGWLRRDDALSADDHAALDAVIGWAESEQTIGAFLARCDDTRRRLAELRDPSAPVELVTVHGAKGREWDTVVIIGWEADRFPNRRAIVQAANPGRALEEERRLGYVALTRATRRVILAFVPDRPSRFLAEMRERLP